MSNVNEYNASTDKFEFRPFLSAEQAVINAIDAVTKTVQTTAVPTSATYGSTTSAAYTLQATDLNKVVEVSNSSGTTITIPSDPNDTVFPIGFSAEFRQMGDGRLTFEAVSPATLSSTEGYVKTRIKYSSVVVEKRASNAWILVGDTDA